jgi:hypothetical protein
LLIIRSEAAFSDVEPVDDSGSKCQTCCLGHEHISACQESGLDVDGLGWMDLRIKYEDT